MTISMLLPAYCRHPKKNAQDIVEDVSALLQRSSSNGDLVNPYSVEHVVKECTSTNSELLTQYDDDLNELLGCLIMTDRDFYKEDLESKEFLLRFIPELSILCCNNEQDLSDKIKVMWMSSTCTSPDARGKGIATKLYSTAEKIALRNSPDSDYVVLAQAIRPQNKVMRSFSEKQGFSFVEQELSAQDFGANTHDSEFTWVISYKLIKKPELEK